jgi:hypothetical protein
VKRPVQAGEPTRAHQNRTARRFEADRYLVVRPLLDARATAFYYRVALHKARMGRMSEDDQVPGTPAAGSEPLMDRLLVEMLPKMEQVTGLELFPTYSYMRVYKRGDVLHRHTDRESCEVSASLCLGFSAPSRWPLWIEAAKGKKAIRLSAGEALLYRGIECPHWREAFEGDHCAQLFLHYVDKNGPYAAWRNDKRIGLYGIAPVRPATKGKREGQRTV